MQGGVVILHPSGMHQQQGPTPIGVACTGPTVSEDQLVAKKTEEALLPEGWKQQVGAENLLHPERSSWRIRKTIRKRRIEGESENLPKVSVGPG